MKRFCTMILWHQVHMKQPVAFLNGNSNNLIIYTSLLDTHRHTQTHTQRHTRTHTEAYTYTQRHTRTHTDTHTDTHTLQTYRELGSKHV